MNELISKTAAAANVINAAYQKYDLAEQKRNTALNEYEQKKKRCEKLALIMTAPVIILILLSSGLAEKLGLLFYIISFVAILVPASFIEKKKKTRIKKYAAEKDEELKECEEIYKSGTQIMNENADVVSFIPVDYRYPLAAGYFVDCFRNGRAENMKEALALFDEQLHRWKVENNQQQILQQQYVQSQQLNNVRQDIRVNTATSMVNGAINILSKL